MIINLFIVIYSEVILSSVYSFRHFDENNVCSRM